MKSPIFKNHALLLGWVAALLMARPMWAVQTEKFVNDSFEDFAEGEAHGMAIGSDGFVRLGLESMKWAPLATPAVWAAVQDAAGVLFVAAGNEGQVFRIGANGKAEEYFKADELQVQALVLGPDGALYVASAPDGKIYRVEAKGRSSVFFDPKEKYIWALQFAPSGDLFAATGDKGKLYKISSLGKGHVFYDSDETHLRTMQLDASGRLWVGSEGNGLVYRFDQLRGSEATPFVAYDSTFREIKALAIAPDGSVFVGAMGDGKAPHPMPFTPKGLPGNGVSSNATIAALGAMISMAHEGPKAEALPLVPPMVDKPGAGEIVRILPDGSAEKWWSDSEDVYALAVGEEGRLWAGTGRKGRVLEFVAARQWNVVAQLEAETISVLLRRPHGGWLAATSNAGALWTLAASPGRKGTLESKIFEAQSSARWGRLDFQTTNGRGHVALFTRSGNTAKPDKVWSNWTPLNAQGRVQSPVASHLQYRLEIEAEGGAGAVVAVDSVTLFYQSRNQAPSITRISVFPTNIELVRMPKMEGPLPPLNAAPAAGAANGHSPKATGTEALAAAMMAAARTPPIQQVRRLGWRSAIWQASDPDNDTLSFEVSYRAAGAERWKTLQKGVKDNFLAWDAATWPDGFYYLRVVASDLADNREDEARTGEWTSDVFVVDNTAPEIQADLSAVALAKGSLALTISDSTSVVDQAEYSLDGADWRPLPPVGGIYDAKSNRFLIPIQRLKAGEHYVVVRASDAADNVASRTINFTK